MPPVKFPKALLSVAGDQYRRKGDMEWQVYHICMCMHLCTYVYAQIHTRGRSVHEKGCHGMVGIPCGHRICMCMHLSTYVYTHRHTRVCGCAYTRINMCTHENSEVSVFTQTVCALLQYLFTGAYTPAFSRACIYMCVFVLVSFLWTRGDCAYNGTCICEHVYVCAHF
jgi:hypothetical protein